MFTQRATFKEYFLVGSVMSLYTVLLWGCDEETFDEPGKLEFECNDLTFTGSKTDKVVKNDEGKLPKAECGYDVTLYENADTWKFTADETAKDITKLHVQHNLVIETSTAESVTIDDLSVDPKSIMLIVLKADSGKLTLNSGQVNDGESGIYAMTTGQDKDHKNFIDFGSDMSPQSVLDKGKSANDNAMLSKIEQHIGVPQQSTVQAVAGAAVDAVKSTANAVTAATSPAPAPKAEEKKPEEKKEEPKKEEQKPAAPAPAPAQPAQQPPVAQPVPQAQPVADPNAAAAPVQQAAPAQTTPDAAPQQQQPVQASPQQMQAVQPIQPAAQPVQQVVPMQQAMPIQQAMPQQVMPVQPAVVQGQPVAQAQPAY